MVFIICKLGFCKNQARFLWFARMLIPGKEKSVKNSLERGNVKRGKREKGESCRLSVFFVPSAEMLIVNA